MIDISESAQGHFRRLIEREAIPGLGVRLSASDAGTPRADVRLEFDFHGQQPNVNAKPIPINERIATVKT
mgnify:CR=1 FL=1